MKNWLYKIAEGEDNKKESLSEALEAALKTPFGVDSTEDIVSEAVDNAKREAGVSDGDTEYGIEVKVTIVVEIDGKKVVDVKTDSKL